jgi:acyl carrier protein
VNLDDAHALLARALHVVAPEVELGTVDEDALLQDELDLDSMDFLNLVTALHDETGLDIPERDYPQLATVGGFVDYLSRAVEGSNAPGGSA